MNSAATQTFCGRCNHPMHWRVCGSGLNFTRCECRNDVSYAELPIRSIPAGQDTELLHENYVRGYRRGRSSSRAWLLLALGVGAALGFVAGWVARSL